MSLFVKFCCLGKWEGKKTSTTCMKYRGNKDCLKYRCWWRSSYISTWLFQKPCFLCWTFQAQFSKFLKSIPELSPSARVHHVVPNTPYMSDIGMPCSSFKLFSYGSWQILSFLQYCCPFQKGFFLKLPFVFAQRIWCSWIQSSLLNVLTECFRA